MTVTARLLEIADIGRDPVRGGYSRHLFDDGETLLRDWFRTSAEALGLTVEEDTAANLWAWWGVPAAGAIATGSHLDSVPGGGAYDGPLGVASAFEAVAQLRAEGFAPQRPIAVCAFAEEEGSRFGLPCFGTRILTGAVPPSAVLTRRDADGIALEDAWRASGRDPGRLGADTMRVGELAAFVELHVEQGLDLEERAEAVAVASAIIPHGRWRLSITGEGNHAGTTTMIGRRDPVVALARSVLAAHDVACERMSGARATVGRVQITPNGTNVIASRVEAWLDLRAETDDELADQIAQTMQRIDSAVAATGCTVDVQQESLSPRVDFDAALTQRISRVLGGVPAIPTGAGHDAGILCAHVPTAMIFVRNPTGVSHAPAESAREDDCERGAAALAAVLRDLASDR